MSDLQKNQQLTLLFAVIVLLLLTGGGFLWYRYLMRPPEVEWAYNDLPVAPLPQAIPARDRRATIEASIRQILQTQQNAWNSGKIDEFMEFYWKSEDLTFSSGGKVTRGWQATLDNYKKKYSSPREMGQLDFQDLEISLLGNDAALVLGMWKLTRESGNLGGNFSLVFRRTQSDWVIVHDHTSSANQQSE